jgi:hypothetical protein
MPTTYSGLKKKDDLFSTPNQALRNMLEQYIFCMSHSLNSRPKNLPLDRLRRRRRPTLPIENSNR